MPLYTTKGHQPLYNVCRLELLPGEHELNLEASFCHESDIAIRGGEQLTLLLGELGYPSSGGERAWLYSLAYLGKLAHANRKL